MVFRVQQEKEVYQELLQISQPVQNFADRNTIDYTKYLGTSDEGQGTSLVDTKWITNILYLSWQDGQISLYTTGDCVEPAIDYMLTGAWSWCSLYVAMQGKTVELINTKKIVLSKAVFKIIPFASQDQYLNGTWLCDTENYLHCLNTPGFRMIFKAYSINYGTQRATHIVVPFQQFF